MKRAAAPKGKDASRAILVSGTPCCGKTTLAKRLAKRIGFLYIDGNQIAREHSSSYDKRRRCYVVDETIFCRAATAAIRRAKGCAVLDSHLAHLVAPKTANACIVVRCPLKTLHRRLVKRGYPKAKIDENMECEIMEVCLEEARTMGHRVIEVQGTVTSRTEEITERIVRGKTREKKSSR